MNSIFPKVKEIKQGGMTVTLSSPIKVRADVPFGEQAFAYLASLVKCLFGRDAVLGEGEADIIFSARPMHREGYEIIIDGGVNIYSSDLPGAIYAASTLAQLIERGEELTLPGCRITDLPFAAFRGLHAYLPARENIGAFKSIIDTMALLKMNTLILEIGGGMEYERHPEINAAWEKFCRQLDSEFPGHGKYRALQGSDFYWKDSVHTELAGGSYLTKEEVADLVKHCRERGIEVIPEIQALSHAYYLCVAHPEIAELKDDPFPDTYCPSDERSYRLYFEVAEEIIELIRPSTVSIGHDEIRVLAWCDRCRGKSGAELVGGEILRLHEFYKERGIRIAMWGESAQSFVNYKGRMVGTEDQSGNNKYGYHYHLPSTCRCLSSLPEDILMIDWYHSLGQDSEDCFDARGMETVFGNFHGTEMSDWQRRSKKACFRGAEVSSWCVTDEYTFGRDGIFFEMAFSANMLWRSDYSEESYGEDAVLAAGIMEHVRSVMRGFSSPLSENKPCRRLYLGEREKAAYTLDTASAKALGGRVGELIASEGKALYGVPFDRGGIIIRTDTYAESLLFIHNTKKELRFEPSHLFKDKNDWAVGAYAVRYEDGSVELAPLFYGTELGFAGFSLGRHRNPTDKNGFEIDIENPGEDSFTPVYYTHSSQWTESLLYGTTPILAEKVSAFAYEWHNPHPEKKIVGIKPINVMKDTENTAVLFGVYAVG